MNDFERHHKKLHYFSRFSILAVVNNPNYQFFLIIQKLVVFSNEQALTSAIAHGGKVLRRFRFTGKRLHKSMQGLDNEVSAHSDREAKLLPKLDLSSVPDSQLCKLSVYCMSVFVLLFPPVPRLCISSSVCAGCCLCFQHSSQTVASFFLPFMLGPSCGLFFV